MKRNEWAFWFFMGWLLATGVLMFAGLVVP